MKFPEGSKWEELVRLLWDLGGQAQWNPEMAPWLSNYVLPLLKWAIGNGKQAATEAV
jgi:hypothetical protein